MRFETTESFFADFRRLTLGEKEAFVDAVREINRDWARRGAARVPRWPARLRVKDVEGAPGVWEMTWSWPDGRATFEYVEVQGELAIRWRRIGGHCILGSP